MRIPVLVGALLAAAPAFADGFATRDLTTVRIDTAVLSPGDWISRVGPDRVTLACFGCAGDPLIDILVGRQDDGTEARIRSGETTMETMRALCVAKEPACTLDALDAGAGVGWITTYPLGGQSGSTVAILKGGDLLTIRSLAEDTALARGNAEALVASIAPQVVGP